MCIIHKDACKQILQISSKICIRNLSQSVILLQRALIIYHLHVNSLVLCLILSIERHQVLYIILAGSREIKFCKLMKDSSFHLIILNLGCYQAVEVIDVIALQVKTCNP